MPTFSLGTDEPDIPESPEALFRDLRPRDTAVRDLYLRQGDVLRDCARWPRLSNIWAICPERLSGRPFQHVLKLHFGDRVDDAELVTEVRMSNPTLSFVGIGVLTLEDGNDVELVGIEAQTIDTRGGAIQPLWHAYIAGEPHRWKDYYAKANQKPAFAVNTTNVWKRLLPQVMNKGRLYRDWDTKLYVVLPDTV
jgi:hypothetical protein